MACEGPKTIELLNFNNETGTVSNAYTLATFQEQFATYGTEFSPGGNFLYCTTNVPANVYQFNLKAGSSSAIAASQTLVGSSSAKCGAMQTGPDGKIYIVNQDGVFLSAINNPDVAGAACNFVDNAVTCTGGVLGLPNYVAEQFCATIINKPVALFNTPDTILCAGNCATFNNLSTFASSCKWIFPGANSPTSTDSAPLPAIGHDVELIAFSGNSSDTLLLKKYITVNPLPVAGTVTSSKDTICINSGLKSKLTLTDYSGHIQWQSSSSGSYFTYISLADSNIYTTLPALQQTTTYRAIVSNSCGADTTNSVTVNIVPSPDATFTYVLNDKQVTFNSTGSSTDVTVYDWDFGDGGTSNEANPSHFYSAIDVYTVCLTVYNGSNCSYTLCQQVDLHINGIAAVQEPVFVSPNPVTGPQLSVSISDNIELSSVHISVIDLLGREVLNLLPNGNPTLLDTGSLPAGVYFLSVQSGNDLFVQKFVKQ